MNNDKPFWETKNNHITGYVVESFSNTVKLSEIPRTYKTNGDRYCRTYSTKKRVSNGLAECVILNNED